MIGASTRLAAVLGWPVAHSLSPRLHNAAYAALGIDTVYVALPVLPERLAEAFAGLRALGFMGANITVPHKQAALHLCDQLDPIAEKLGAVNTVVVSNAGELCGYNTDVDGFSDALSAHDATFASDVRQDPAPFGTHETSDAPRQVTPRRAAVLGSGGAARAVVLALARLDVTCRIIARNGERARDLLALGATGLAPWTFAAFQAELPKADLLVDATSIGLSAKDESSLPMPVPLDLLPERALVCSLVYHREPALLAFARARGLKTCDGKGMLIHQAARAFSLMTGREAPLEVMKSILFT